jgi:hypothetical protein
MRLARSVWVVGIIVALRYKPSNSLALAMGSGLRTKVSPTKMASMPASSNTCTCSRVSMPLSLTMTQPSE